MVHCFSVLLSLTQDGTELELELALHVHLLHSLGDADIFEEVRFLYDLNCFLKINDTLFKHAQLLEAHCHVEVGDVSKVSVSLAVLQVDYFQDTLCLLK